MASKTRLVYLLITTFCTAGCGYKSRNPVVKTGYLPQIPYKQPWPPLCQRLQNNCSSGWSKASVHLGAEQ